MDTNYFATLFIFDIILLEVAGVPFRPSASCLVPTGRAQELAAHLVCALPRFRSALLDDRLPLLVKRRNPPNRRVSSFWRWRESDPRPGTRAVGVYRFRRALYCRGALGCTACGVPVSWLFSSSYVQARKSTSLDCDGNTAAQGGAAGSRVLPLTRRERNCRCWQLKGLPYVRRTALHLQPTTRIVPVETGAPPGDVSK